MVAGVPNVWTANLLLASLYFAELLRLTLQVVAYRRGFKWGARRSPTDQAAAVSTRGNRQQHLADRIGVTRQTVNAIEAGKYSPSLEVAFRIAHVFNAPLEAVFQFEAPAPSQPS